MEVGMICTKAFYDDFMADPAVKPRDDGLTKPRDDGLTKPRDDGNK